MVLSSSKIPTSRESINLKSLLCSKDHPTVGVNPCLCISVKDPKDENQVALLNGIRKVLPFMYRFDEDVIKDLKRYGMDFSSKISYFPKDPDFQKAHFGEILTCTYFEECEEITILTYKWRLNTSLNQNQLGMDILAFNLNTSPIKIYAIAVKTTYDGASGKNPTAFYKAVYELNAYIADKKLDNDLVITSANLHVTDPIRIAFEDWYNPYTQLIPDFKPELIPVPVIIIDENNWQNKFADYPINHDFGMPSIVRVIQVKNLEDFVVKTYSGGKS